jgi:hypothetical protein
VGRQANPKGLDLGLASDCPGRAFSRSGGKFASLAAGHRAGDRVGPERSHADRKSISTLTASSRVGSYPRGAAANKITTRHARARGVRHQVKPRHVNDQSESGQAEPLRPRPLSTVL